VAQPSPNLASSLTPATPGPPTVQIQDAVLLDRCRAGDLMAFGLLVERYQDRVFNAVLRMCGNRDDAEELSQETFVKVLENLTSFRQASGFYTWLFRIAVNLTISRRRRAGRVKFHSLDASASDDDAAPSQALADTRQDGPAELAGSADVNRQVAAALEALEEGFRVVVVLRDVEGMNYDQIAQILNIPVGTVKSRLYRARNLLAQQLRDIVN
jgi:RNA polymerase sigma-70 factor (ECF subfamily)